MPDEYERALREMKRRQRPPSEVDKVVRMEYGLQGIPLHAGLGAPRRGALEIPKSPGREEVNQ